MATSPVTTNATNSNPNLKPQTQDWGLQLVTKDVDGTKSYSVKAIQGDAEIQKAEKDGSLLLKQTFGFDFPANDAGQKEVIPDDKERNDVFIAGLKARNIGPRIRRVLEEIEDDKDAAGMPIPTFQQEEGVYDFREKIKEAAQRQNLTPEQKALKNLRAIPVFANMTDDQLRMFIGNAASLAGASADSDEGEASSTESEADANMNTATV